MTRKKTERKKIAARNPFARSSTQDFARPFYFRGLAIPFFFRFLSNAFSDFGSVGRKRTKNKNKIGKGVWSYEARFLSMISVEPGNNMVWLQQSQHRGNGGRKKSTSLLKLNENREKLKICKAKNCLCFRLKWQLFETMCHCLHCLLCNFFFFENAKIWVGRTTLNREKKGDGVFFRVTHDGLRERGTTRSLYLVRYYLNYEKPQFTLREIIYLKHLKLWKNST